MNRFDETLAAHDIEPVRREDARILQCNITRRCNMACRHCHVESSPARDEAMSRPVMERIIDLARDPRVDLVDITGGAPELHPDFRWFIDALQAIDVAIQVRSNLTVHTLPEMDGCLEALAAAGVRLVASLPCYLEENVEAQRGKNVFTPSIAVLRRANSLGYGRQLPLHLVYNPVGKGLPGPQAELEAAYRRELDRRYGIVFTGLYTITNMPIGRFAHDLARAGELDGYLQRLADAFNPATVDGLMCRHQIEIDHDGRIFDCDFNLALDLPAADGASILSIDPDSLLGATVVTGQHCLGCCAGCGSSCGGALVDDASPARAAS